MVVLATFRTCTMQEKQLGSCQEFGTLRQSSSLTKTPHMGHLQPKYPKQESGCKSTAKG